MCMSNGWGGNCCWIIVILLVLFCCCGNGSGASNWGGCGNCGNDCGC